MLAVSLSSVGRAAAVQRRGTQEEIAGVKKGKMSLRPIADGIRAGESPEARKKKRDAPISTVGKNPERY